MKSLLALTVLAFASMASAADSSWIKVAVDSVRADCDLSNGARLRINVQGGEVFSEYYGYHTCKERLTTVVAAIQEAKSHKLSEIFVNQRTGEVRARGSFTRIPTISRDANGVILADPASVLCLFTPGGLKSNSEIRILVNSEVVFRYVSGLVFGNAQYYQKFCEAAAAQAKFDGTEMLISSESGMSEPALGFYSKD